MKKEIQLQHKEEEVLSQYHKVILTDADGVLLNWGYAFDVWMTEKGYTAKSKLEYNVGTIYDIAPEVSKRLVREFNESAHMGFVPPLRDAMQYVRKLHEEHGYVFHLITSMSKDENAQKLRTMNIKKLFGEDKVENAIAGDKQGLDSIVMEHGYNMDNQDYPLMKNWKDVYEYLVG